MSHILTAIREQGQVLKKHAADFYGNLVHTSPDINIQQVKGNCGKLRGLRQTSRIHRDTYRTRVSLHQGRKERPFHNEVAGNKLELLVFSA